MRLESSDGARVDLRLLGYQFPNADDRWDANWLLVRGDVWTADGRSWAFVDPCLMTAEVRRLAEWLRGVADGAVRPTAGRRDAGEVVDFTEPDVAVSLAARDAGGATIRFHFALEAGPPWRAADATVFDDVVEVAAPYADITRAADELDKELVAFPER